MGIKYNGFDIKDIMYKDIPIEKVMLGSQLLWEKQRDIPDYYVMATDDDFSGTTNGEFKYVGAGEYITIPHIIKGVNVTSYKSMFQSNTSTVLKGVASDNPSVTNMSYMFTSSAATSLDLSSFDTSNVTTMGGMFWVSAATSLDLSNFDTSKVTDMESMFYNSAATSLDLSGFDTSNVTNMLYMFMGSAATSLDLSGFDTSNVADMLYMFYGSAATTGYARTKADADRFNETEGKPAGLIFVVK
ncbi:MAG TPA: BspA family leucine-rich repeat surface protein, partial [Tissierellaceae bacterium]|nr:BspA family leucine-rich repeat surface protein [Tissierellaceae bacterium]